MMNERINQLAEQAHRSTRDELVHLERVHNRTYDLNESAAIYNEKFAELIVTECVDVLIDVLPSIVPESKDGIHPVWHIKDHFGFDD